MKRITGAKYDTSESAREIKNRSLAYKAALEGIVLLKNDGALPLEIGEVALYGSGARFTLKGGTGSGEVNVRHSASICKSMKEKGFKILTEQSLDKYDEVMAQAKAAYEKTAREKYTIVDIWSLVFKMPIAPMLNQEDLADCKNAVYVIARQAGEGKDRQLDSDFRLDEKEAASIRLLCSHYEKVTLIINAGSMIDLSAVDDCNINAIIFFCQQGMEGSRALVSLLTGEENFSGKLSDTWVYSYDDVPYGNEFSYLNGDPDREYYKEGIYVGYRYYDTFKVPVRYHFGYGLSYTYFLIDTLETTVEGKEVKLKVLVKNTGKQSGKEVVQVYVSCPQGKLDKEYQRLVAFKKSSKLDPDQEEIMEISFDMTYCASFNEESDSFILEKGRYLIRTGNSSANTKTVAAVNLNETIVISKHENLLACKEQFEQLHALPCEEENTDGLKILELDPANFETKVYQYPPIEKCKDEAVASIMAKLTLEDKIRLVCGEMDENHNCSINYIYTPGTVGRTTETLIDKGVINANLCDGPAGLRLLKESAIDKDGKIKYLKDNYPVAALELFTQARPLEEGDTVLYQYPTAWPVATALAQTFNTELIEEVGRITSEEMLEFNVTYWLAPGMNIHKNPLCGRNFEYYSEDPLLSGKIASALLQGVESIPGHYITIKHLICNNAEDRRNFSDSIVSKRALREIYLRGFELAVREGKANGAMTSYNKVNGIYSAENAELTVKILRNEWGFDGVVMTDWTATFAGMADNGKAISSYQLIMPGGGYPHKEIRKALKEGRLTEEDLDITASFVLKAILESNVASRIKAEELI